MMQIVYLKDIIKGEKDMKKKLISMCTIAVLSFSIFCGSIAENSYAIVNDGNSGKIDISQEIDNSPLKVLNKNSYENIKKKSIDIKTVSSAEKNVLSGENQAVLYHNDGKPLDAENFIKFDEVSEMENTPSEVLAEKNRLRESCENAGFNYIDEGRDTSPIKVFGIYIYKTESNTLGEAIITSNGNEMSPDEISDNIATSIKNGTARLSSEQSTIKAAQKNPDVRTISTTYKSGTTKVATLTGSVTHDRKTKNASIDGKAGSIWDVDMFAEVECTNGRKVSSEYIWLNTNQTNQKLIKYGPVGDKGKSGGYTITLAAAYGIASISFPVTFGGSYTRTDMTSLSGKYGKWKIATDSTAAKSSLTTQAAIRTSNTSGSLIIKGKMEITLINLVGRSWRSTTYTWGTQTYTIADR